MMLEAIYQQRGAQLASDGIPLHFGQPQLEYQAALNDAVLLDRSHEGRLALTGSDRLELLNRMSTNNMLNIPVGAGRPTIFTNANARILDRVTLHNEDAERSLMLAGPGRGDFVLRYLQSNIFYSDDVQVENIASRTHQFALHGATAEPLLRALIPAIEQAAIDDVIQTFIADVPVRIVRLKPLVGSAWNIVTPKADAHTVWNALIAAGMHPSGGIIYNALRIRAGSPGVGFELTDKYIPLELGLWDEVSFNKGCYTGQEIIARMESRNKLAKVLVRLSLPSMIPHGKLLFYEGKQIGEITSSVTAPDGAIYAMGVAKTSIVQPGVSLRAEHADGLQLQMGDIVGSQPMFR